MKILTPLAAINESDAEPFLVIKPDSYIRNYKDAIPVNTFKEFCDACQGNELYALYSFYHNKVTYAPLNNEPKRMNWPDDVIYHKEGNCVDFAVFMHYFFEIFDIDHVIGFVSFIDIEQAMIRTGHAFPIFQRDNRYWLWNYFGSGYEEFDINGPFVSYDHAIEKTAPYFSVLYSSVMKKDKNMLYAKDCVKTYLNRNDLKFLDKHYNQSYLSQNDILLQSPKIVEVLQQAVKKTQEYHNSIINLDDMHVDYMFRHNPTDFGIKNIFQRFRGIGLIHKW